VKGPRYIIFDGRYRFDEESATVMDMANSLNEAKEAAKNQGDCVIVDNKTGEIIEYQE